MNKQSALEQIREEAFQDELEKVALSPRTIFGATKRSAKLMRQTGLTSGSVVRKGLKNIKSGLKSGDPTARQQAISVIGGGRMLRAMNKSLNRLASGNINL